MKILLMSIMLSLSFNASSIELTVQQVAAAHVSCSLYADKVKDIKKSKIHMKEALKYYSKKKVEHFKVVIFDMVKTATKHLPDGYVGLMKFHLGKGATCSKLMLE
ncbi:MAG TPA: hypothetical protein EYN67_18020 [Flavobacteriales bacterium]|nr:hypothetical protein [Methylococcaceae bacterium]HHZ97391.1 hypothetical protein [Flavobacteriales bacterium]